MKVEGCAAFIQTRFHNYFFSCAELFFSYRFLASLLLFAVILKNIQLFFKILSFITKVGFGEGRMFACIHKQCGAVGADL